MKRIRELEETRSEYNNRIQKGKYKNDEDYKYKIKLRYYLNKYKDDLNAQEIIGNDDLSNKDKFLQLKMLSMTY